METVPTSGLLELEGAGEGVTVRGSLQKMGRLLGTELGVPHGCRCSIDVSLPTPASLVFAADFWNIEMGIDLCVTVF